MNTAASVTGNTSFYMRHRSKRRRAGALNGLRHQDISGIKGGGGDTAEWTESSIESSGFPRKAATRSDQSSGNGSVSGTGVRKQLNPAHRSQIKAKLADYDFFDGT